MNKTTQTILILGLSGVAVYLLWKNYAPQPVASITPKPAPEPIANPCGKKKGQALEKVVLSS